MNYNEQSYLILSKLEEVSTVFGEYQVRNNLLCPSGCGKCCLNPEISCAPYELLPLAIHLLEEKKAEEFLEKLKNSQTRFCPLLQVIDQERGMGRCDHYRYRPYLCRAFGATARIGKNDRIDLSICSNLEKTDKLDLTEIPLIDLWRRKFCAIDPHLSENELPIKNALIIILEKVLLWDKYRGSN